MIATCFVPVKQGPAIWKAIAPYVFMIFEVYKYIAIPIMETIYIIEYLSINNHAVLAPWFLSVTIASWILSITYIQQAAESIFGAYLMIAGLI